MKLSCQVNHGDGDGEVGLHEAIVIRNASCVKRETRNVMEVTYMLLIILL